jgi:predicted negative regulator of RcsB-dependent stress response
MEEKNDLADVAEVDAFTIYSKKVVEYVNENRSKVIAGIVGFFVLLLAVSYLPVWLDKKESKGYLELQKSLRAMNSAESKPVKEEELVKFFKPVTDNYKGSKVFGYANLFMARSLYESGDLEKAKVYYEKAGKSLSDDKLLSDIVNYELGCLDFDKEKSSSYFDKLVKTNGFLEEEALFYLSMSGNEESLEKLNNDFPDGFYSEIVKERVAKTNKKN